MKRRTMVVVVAAMVVLALLSVAGSAVAGPPERGPTQEGDVQLAGTVASKISYQGRLTDTAGNPLNGSYNLLFQLWNDASAGSQVGSDIVKTGVSVSNGLFTVELDVPQSAFNGQALWLRIQVNGQWLSPRQPLLPAPYALSLRPGAVISGEAPVLTARTGNVVGELATSVSSGGLLPTIIPIGVRGIASAVGNIGVDGEASGGATVAVRGRATDTGDVTNYGGYFEAYGNQGRGVMGAVTGSQAQGVVGYAIGASAIAVYGEATSAGGLGVKGKSNSSDGVVGQSGGNTKSGVYGYNTHSGGFGVYGRNTGTGNVGYLGGTYGAYGESGANTGTGVFGRATNSYGRGVFGYSTGSLGIGVMAEADGNDAYGVYAIAQGARSIGIYAQGGAGGYAGEFRGNVKVTSSSTGATIIELGEGLDFAEGFNVTDESPIEPGTVLVIDPDHPGQLTVSTESYDHKVAGIVAGANGLGSGVRLGVDQYDYDVALAGRVYCNVDATYGEVSPGDLLTTSPTPGYAMVVKDYEKAQGAILGKAMEGLPAGQKGQILVLLTLQ